MSALPAHCWVSKLTAIDMLNETLLCMEWRRGEGKALCVWLVERKKRGREGKERQKVSLLRRATARDKSSRGESEGREDANLTKTVTHPHPR